MNRCFPKDPHREMSELRNIDLGISRCRVHFRIAIGTRGRALQQEVMERKCPFDCREPRQHPVLAFTTQQAVTLFAEKRMLELSAGLHNDFARDENGVVVWGPTEIMEAASHQMAIDQRLIVQTELTDAEFHGLPASYGPTPNCTRARAAVPVPLAAVEVGARSGRPSDKLLRVRPRKKES